MSAFTHSLSTNNYGPAKIIVATSAANGTHTTLATAMAAASVGDTIFLRDSVTENVTITPGVNIAAWYGSSLNKPTITGTLTMNGAGTSSISGIELVTNSAFAIAVTGSATSILNLNNCYINCSNNTGISLTSSDANSVIRINNSRGNIGTTGISLFTMSGSGLLEINYCFVTNTGGSSTASTVSAGTCSAHSSELRFPITTSGTGQIGLIFSSILSSAQNVTCITHGSSTTSSVRFCRCESGSASAISISVGSTLFVIGCQIASSNTNAITGAGSITYAGLLFNSTSSNINTTTQALYEEGPSKTIGSSNSGNTNTLIVTNDSNTATSASNILAQVAGGTAADPTHQSSVSGVTTWTWGIDNSDSDSYVLAQGTALGTNNVMHVLTTGEINFPLQSAFLATHSAAQTNVTGAGTTVTVNFTTEVFDQNSDYDGTNTYTAPVTGRIVFNASVRFDQITVAMTQGQISIVTSNRSYTSQLLNFGVVQIAANVVAVAVSVLADLDAADTCIVQVTVANGAGDTADLNAAVTQTYFSGYLAC
jgi:hypothetical protein